jgi:short-subunit dehydrogenase
MMPVNMLCQLSFVTCHLSKVEWSAMKRRIDGMVVVITGASAGIGRELAVQLAGRGAKLVLGARRVDKLEELNRQLGGNHFVVACDVSKTADCQALVDAATKAFGRIDTLVCNAGYGEFRRMAETTSEQFEAIFRTNVFGTMDCVRFALPVMLKQEPRDRYRGQIMIVSSAAARRGLPYFGPYAATKAAQLSLAEALRVEMGGKGIAVTSVHPIGTRTDFFQVAEQRGGRKMPDRVKFDLMQDVSVVARKMIRGIEMPRPEVWPFWPHRYLLALGSVMPGVVDRVMGKARGKLDAQK